MTVLNFQRSKPAVLVLNDCPDTLQLLSTALDAGGFQVRSAMVSDFREALQSGPATRGVFAPDVVVYDIGRGEDDDWADLRAFTELPEAAGKPLVITTTNVVKVEGHLEAVYVRSRLQFASTPYDVTDLVARVSAAIGL